MDGLSTLTATEAVGAIHRGELGSEELLDAHVARVDAHDGELNLIVARDVDRARSAAREADAAVRRGDALGPLHGLPMTIKDSFETAGLVTTSGAERLREHIPTRDADNVAALREAGAIVFAKTNLPLYAGDFQTANALHGVSNNPWDPSRTVGGSSGGAAAAIAAGMTLLEQGSDIGGSIRCPAHYCGVFGHKPTWGALSDVGHIPETRDLGVMGPLGRSAADLDLAMTALTAHGVGGNPAAALPPASPAARTVRGLRVGLWAQDEAAPTSRACTEAVVRVGEALAAAGAQVVDDARTATSLGEQHLLYATLLNATMAAGFPERVIEAARHRVAAGEIADPVELARSRGLCLSHLDWGAAHEDRLRLIAEWEALFDRVDVVVAPIAPTSAFPHDVERSFDDRYLDVDGAQVPYWSHIVWAGLATLPLLPATAVPAGTHDGLPVGVQLVGRRWADRTTIAVAGLVETLLGGFVAPPGY
ncbi:MAG: amidase family protein [Actinomycetota bacterium]